MVQDNRTIAAIVIGAAAIGLIVGIGSTATSPQGRASIAAKARTVAVAAGVTRRRAPQSGDMWGGCDDARAAGTAPIYRGEPGYRDDMGGDGDDTACEPQRY